MSKRTLQLALLFVVGAFFSDRATGCALRCVFERTYGGDAGGFVNNVLANDDADVFLLGSSRVARNIDSQALSNALNHRVHNAGVHGQELAVARGLQALLLERGATPDLFILQVHASQLDSPLHQRGRVLTPFASNTTVGIFLAEIDPMIRIKLWSNVYPFNGKIFSMIHHLNRESSDQFAPLQGTMPSLPNTTTTASARPLDPLALSLLRGFIEDAEQAEVPTLIIVGPRYRVGPRSARDAHVQAVLADLADASPTTYFSALDEHALPTLIIPENFADSGHLNARGAAVFTEALAAEAASIIVP